MWRRTLYKLHKYSGLLLGAVLALTGLSGSLLVFDHALDEVLTPQLRGLSTQRSAPLQQVLTAAEGAATAGAQATRLHLARQPGSPHTVRFSAPPPGDALIEVSVDPATARVLAVREWGRYPMSWLYRFHYTLLSGHSGKIVVGALGFALLFYGVSGLVLWWPRAGRWRNALQVTRRAGPLRFHRDLHRLVGVISLPVLMLCAVTGVAMVFSKPVSALIGYAAPVREAPSYSVDPDGEPLSLDALVKRAGTTLPDGEVKRLFLPRSATDSLRVSFNLPGEPWSNHGASSLWLNPYTGEVLGLWDARKLPAGNTILSWVFPLHNADVLGLPGRWLWLLAGTTPALLFVTGTYLWWKKRRRTRGRSFLGGGVLAK